MSKQLTNEQNEKDFSSIDRCPYCNSQNLLEYLNLNIPTVERAVPRDIALQIPRRKLVAKLCLDCLLGFNATPLPQEELRFIYEVAYSEGGYILPSQSLGQSKFRGIVDLVSKFIKLREKIVEIGCNDGYLLTILKNMGYQSLVGIEPSNAADIASQNGITVFKTFLNEEILNDIGKVNCFLLVHTIEHFEDPFLALELLKNYLDDEGRIIIEVPNFEGYCHEHLYFFNIPFFYKLAHDMGFSIEEEVVTEDILRIVINKVRRPIEKPVDIVKEYRQKIISLALEKQNQINKIIIEVENIIKDSTKEIYWWGAGSLSVDILTLIDQSLLIGSKLRVIDGDDRKWGMTIPCLNIDVEPFHILKEDGKQKLLIIASSFYEEILRTIERESLQVQEIKIICQMYV
ncbi:MULTISPECIES: class I SAM-dependent methyltransferase [unclassified Thermosynechococcus]|uniref:class I SAM-dependent methyltransferase n=1 Tax=unclassified Thermosynechococcus TaxID=2622553 RepID=UPI002872B527|nr:MULTISPECIES: class I SAM-dependent methyltransferase [unclassified Thermosynechococcus]WNC32646.1 class I SAM-dependent methyltransferase [Thermosynechococcus sp. PKX95]WNC35175.1 class I SAM-dependent methyltransferase [Thermosynechococcus sp. PKX91]WNC37693.1 class I SAM-dependent methyltransferase [Thermosynechococcus sp. WL11]WNC40214.1 class I SAM-dependent methyltransferase [Thermosynechococcus sp. WL17]WNC42734.1 class I SAM-dependent methyltransferase [Thermosynechococcus sp. WL15]